jgi:hypothetical protein
MHGLYLEGFYYREIGERYWVVGNTVMRRIKDLLTDDQRKQAKQAQKERHQGVLVNQLKPRVLRLVEAGLKEKEIMQTLGIARSLLHKVTATFDVGTKQRRKSQAGNPGVTRYSMAYRRKVLREAAALSGGSLTQTRYEELRHSHPGWPSFDSYIKLKPWKTWLKELGIRKGRKSRGPKFSNQQCRDAVERVAPKLERAFSASEYDAHRSSNDPTANTVARRFGEGRWVDALEYLQPRLFELQLA